MNHRHLRSIVTATLTLAVIAASSLPQARPLEAAAQETAGLPKQHEWEDRLDTRRTSGAAADIANMGNYIYVVGTTPDNKALAEMTVRAYDVRDGRIIWTDRYNPKGDEATGTAIVVSKTCVIAGGWIREPGGTSFDGLLRAFDPMTGDLMWDRRIERSGPVFLFDMVMAGDTLMVTGRTTVSGKGDALVMALDPETGNTQWESAFDIGGAQDQGQAIAASGKRVFIAGRAFHGIINGVQVADTIVLAYHATKAKLLWFDVRREAAGFDELVTVAAKGNRVVVGGQVQMADFTLTGYMRAYKGGNGTVLWSQMWGPGRSRINDVVINGKRVFAVGHDNVNTMMRGYLVKNGNFLWEHGQDFNNGDDRHLAVASAGNRVFGVGMGREGGIRGQLGATAFGDGVIVGRVTRNGRDVWWDQYDFVDRRDLYNAALIVGNYLVVAGLVTETNGLSDFFVRVYSVK